MNENDVREETDKLKTVVTLMIGWTCKVPPKVILLIVPIYCQSLTYTVSVDL